MVHFRLSCNRAIPIIAVKGWQATSHVIWMACGASQCYMRKIRTAFGLHLTLTRMTSDIERFRDDHAMAGSNDCVEWAMDFSRTQDSEQMLQSFQRIEMKCRPRPQSDGRLCLRGCLT